MDRRVSVTQAVINLSGRSQVAVRLIRGAK